MNFYSKIVLISATLLSMMACKKEATAPAVQEPVVVNTPTNTMIKIGETYIVGTNAKAVIYSPKALIRGYNEIYVALYDSTDGSRLSAGHCEITAIMDMGSMQHGSPAENTHDSLTSDGFFKSAVVFSMPGAASMWSLKIYFHNHKNEKAGQGSLGVSVIELSPTKFRNPILTLDSNANVYISYISPASPKVGINDFEIVLHKKISGMVYEPIENYSIEIAPEMPSMGHGSPNNVNPVHTGMGHYKGKVNFTMTGLWRVNLKLSKNGTLISSDQYFEITLQ